MNIIFNNQFQQVREQTSVQSLLDQFVGPKLNGIAVAINETIVPKKLWDSHVLQSNDHILVIKATQGG